MVTDNEAKLASMTDALEQRVDHFLQDWEDHDKRQTDVSCRYAANFHAGIRETNVIHGGVFMYFPTNDS